MDTAQPQRRFFLGGLTTPVLAKVAHESATRMTLQQELPFLQLESEMLDEDGRSGCLTGVSVKLRDGMPCLMLDVSYGDTGREETAPFETGIASEQWDSAALDRAADSLVARLSGSTRSRRRTDETQPYGVRTGENASVIVPTPVATAELSAAIPAEAPSNMLRPAPAVDTAIVPAIATSREFALLPVPWYLRWMNWMSRFFAR